MMTLQRYKEPVTRQVSGHVYSQLMTLRRFAGNDDTSPEIQVQDIDTQALIYQQHNYIPPEAILSDFQLTPIVTSAGLAYPSSDGTQAWIATPNGTQLYISNYPIFNESYMAQLESPVVDECRAVQSIEDTYNIEPPSIVISAMKKCGYKSIQEFVHYVSPAFQNDSLNVDLLPECMKNYNERQLEQIANYIELSGNTTQSSQCPEVTMPQKPDVTTADVIAGFSQFDGTLEEYAEALESMYPDNTAVQQGINQLYIAQVSEPQESEPPCVPTNDWRKILFMKLVYDQSSPFDLVRLILYPTIGLAELAYNKLVQQLRSIKILWWRPFGWIPYWTIYEELLGKLQCRSYELMCTFAKFARDITMGLPIGQDEYISKVNSGKEPNYSSAKLSSEQKRVLQLLQMGYNTYQSKYVSEDYVKRVLGDVLVYSRWWRNTSRTFGLR